MGQKVLPGLRVLADENERAWRRCARWYPSSVIQLRQLRNLLAHAPKSSTRHSPPTCGR